MQHQETLSEIIVSMATQRGPDKTTCPSEIARKLFPNDWRRQMKSIVEAAIELHQQGKVVITQKGLSVDVDHIKGPIRIKII